MTRLTRSMSRRKKKPDEKKDASIRVRLTDEQKAIIEAAASRDGLDLSSYARVAMLEKARRAPTP
jgi:uncharacterized protein (DUF1778 family)